jgi:hypothetical protein
MMFLKMITYDSEYGDAIVFDDYQFSATTYEEFLVSVLSHFDLLLKNQTLIIDRESGLVNVVATQSGKTAESFVLAYRSKKDLAEGINGLTVADCIFYDPDKKEVSCGFDAYSFWDRFSDEDDDVVNAWGLADVLENQPPQLDGTQFDQAGGFQGLELAKFLFELYQSSLRRKD